MDTRNPNDIGREGKVGEFVTLLTAQQARIYAYILSLAPNFNDADDILQDTTKLMWEKFDDFVLGTDFLAWGKKIAYYQIMDYYRNKRKNDMFCYDENLIGKLDQNSKTLSDSPRDYQAYLNDCLKKLKQQDRTLLKLRYFENHKAQELASRFSCSVQYIYRNISRIHQLLLACIKKQVILKDSV